MIRLHYSKSFAQKKESIQNTLPPLIKKNIKSINLNNNNRPTFIIRKKNYSIVQSITTRRIIDKKQNGQRGKYGDGGSQELKISGENEYCQKSGVNKKNYNKIITETNNQISQKQNDINNMTKKAKKVQNIDSYLLNSIPTPKSTKKNSKKRKIQQCKIIKIVWGGKNQIFDVSISEIQQKNQLGHDTPVQSLQELIAQIL